MAFPFTIFPAIDLRHGQVVRLVQGDPGRQTVYSASPAGTARRWLDSGATWLHVVNLDGAFGEENGDNRLALTEITLAAAQYHAQVQLGGGLRTLESIRAALDTGVARVILGTVIVEQPEVLQEALREFGTEKIVAGIDARLGHVGVRGWAEQTEIQAVELARKVAGLGVRWLIYTDIARDGASAGVNEVETGRLARLTGLNVIASGGVKELQDIQRAYESGLAGIIIGRALYEGHLSIDKWQLP